MKKIMGVFLFQIVILIVSGCSVRVNHQIEVKRFDEFEKKEDAFYYELTDGKNINFSINTCATQIQFTDYDENRIKVEVAYNDQDKRDKLNFVYKEDDVTIKRTDQKSDNCSKIKEIDSYIRISLPQQLSVVMIDINNYHSDVKIQNVTYQKFDMEQVNGPIEINFSTIGISAFHVTNGIIIFNNNSGEHLIAHTVNGNVDMNSSEYTKAELETTNGNGIVVDSVFDTLNLITSNGNLTIENSKIFKGEFDTVNGNILLDNVNNSNELPSNSEFSLKTTNGDLLLNDVYATTVTLETVNGNLYYHNDNKDYEVHVLYDYTNGSKNIEVNGTVEKK